MLALTSAVKCHLGKKGKEANLCTLHHPHKQKPCIEDHVSGLEMQNQLKYISRCCHRMGQRRRQVNIIFIRREGDYEAIACNLLKVLGKG